MFASRQLLSRAAVARPAALPLQMMAQRPLALPGHCAAQRRWSSETPAAPFQLVVRMDIPADKDQLFNDVYNEHCQNLREVPGVLGIRRYKTGLSVCPSHMMQPR
jgi:hypothetical protein